MKILSETENDDGSCNLEVDLTAKEEFYCLEVGEILTPDETDNEALIQEALLYFIVLGMIKEYDEDD